MDIGQMIESDWKAEVSFFHHMTGIDPEFFDKYMTRNLDFGLQKVTKMPERISGDDM
ncbi:hypothetical protein [Paenibacillus durus]|uniref:hypothetical protein n=1 Tax=Paenibacillus durus TaxID=44251 RepID=UPI0004BA941F|nr:hypothetical protein [Paenibacillus durus]